MKKTIAAAVAFILVFAGGCSTETQKQREERNERISKNAQEIHKNNEDLMRLLKRGPSPTTGTTEE